MSKLGFYILYMMRHQLRILPNTRLEAAHLTNKCDRTLTLLKTLLVFQLLKDSKKKLISEVMQAKFISLKRFEFLMAKMILIASPYKMRW